MEDQQQNNMGKKSYADMLQEKQAKAEEEYKANEMASREEFLRNLEQERIMKEQVLQAQHKALEEQKLEYFNHMKKMNGSEYYT